MADFTALKRELRQRAQITARRVALEWEDQVQSSEPVKTGQMKAKTRMRDQPTASGFRITGEVDTSYAEFVSLGTRPHRIVPRNAQALRFYWPRKGGIVYFRSVNHPGTQPNDFWTKPLSKLPQTIQGIWTEVNR